MYSSYRMNSGGFDTFLALAGDGGIGGAYPTSFAPVRNQCHHAQLSNVRKFTHDIVFVSRTLPLFPWALMYVGPSCSC